jgi:tRNA U34 2-thiouridine synthase MnmA/TrmU
MNRYSLRINPQSKEIHIFENEGLYSICGRVDKRRTQSLSVNRKTGEGKSSVLKRLDDLSAEEVRSLADSFSSISLNICGTCLSSLYRTAR